LKQLEDVEIQIPDLAPHGSSALAGTRCAFYGVFDGHAGRSAAEFTAEHLHANIASRIEAPSDNEQVRKAICDGFKETDQKYCALANQQGYKDGCTAVTLTIIKDVCFVSWVGDSKCVLGRRESEDKNSRLKALTVTKDHTCMQVKERDRIVKNGGFVENNRVNGIMEVTRSIGDVQLKKSGVISLPQIERVTLNSRDEFFLLACDGLWAVMDAKEAVERVMRGLEEGKDEEKAAMELVREAVRVREAKDNVSALVVRITSK